MEGTISFSGYKEQESSLILPEHDDDDNVVIFNSAHQGTRVSYNPYRVITRLTSDPANEDFFAVFRTRLTNVLVDARTNIKQQT